MGMLHPQLETMIVQPDHIIVDRRCVTWEKKCSRIISHGYDPHAVNAGDPAPQLARRGTWQRASCQVSFMKQCMIPEDKAVVILPVDCRKMRLAESPHGSEPSRYWVGGTSSFKQKARVLQYHLGNVTQQVHAACCLSRSQQFKTFPEPILARQLQVLHCLRVLFDVVPQGYRCLSLAKHVP